MRFSLPPKPEPNQPVLAYAEIGDYVVGSDEKLYSIVSYEERIKDAVKDPEFPLKIVDAETGLIINAFTSLEALKDNDRKLAKGIGAIGLIKKENILLSSEEVMWDL